MTPAGLGLDSIEIDRIQRSAARPAFLRRVYTEGELAYAGDRYESLAAIFAAKEAFGKAVGSGISGFGWRDVEVCHKESGAPFLCLHGQAAEAYGHLQFLLSLTHDRSHATAAVFAFIPGKE